MKMMSKKNFINYVYSFYGKNEGIYKTWFNNSLSKNEIKKAIEYRIKNIKIPLDYDSVDRELVRDILFKMRNPKAITEHNV
jgi:hypothetical protein